MSSVDPRPHAAVWPARLPRNLVLPETTLWFNLEVSARRYPHKAACLFFGRPLSFADLHAQALALAGWLQAQGVQKGDRVLLFMQNCPQYLVAFYAVQRDDAVVVPLHTLQRRVTGTRKVNTLSVSMEEGSDSTRLKASLRQLLRERRKLAEGDDDNFNIFDTQQLAETLSSTMGVLTTLLGAVAAVSLLVGGIGIMNIMLVSVTERTREIGLRLAVGALEGEVLLQFLIEAVVLSALGGVVGIVIATGASYVGSLMMAVPYVFDPTINVLSLVFSAFIGVVFGYFPARRAARMDPIEALRHE